MLQPLSSVFPSDSLTVVLDPHHQRWMADIRRNLKHLYKKLDKAKICVLKGTALHILFHTWSPSDGTGWAHIAKNSSTQSRASSGSSPTSKPCFRQGRGLSGGLTPEHTLSKSGWSKEPWSSLPGAGKGLFLRSCLYPTKLTLTHWFPSALHSLSKPTALNPVHRPTDSITFPLWAKSLLLNKAL